MLKDSSCKFVSPIVFLGNFVLFIMFTLLYNRKPQFLSHFLRNFGDLRYLECSSLIIARSFSSGIHNLKQLKDTSFTVSYLINSCGLSPEDANSASKRVQFVTPERPDSVLTLFKKHGFSPSQITKIVKSRPKILLADPEKTILSRIQFFSSIGITGPNLAELLSSSPLPLQASLSKTCIPVYKFLKNALDFDDYMLIKAMSNASRLYLKDVATIQANLFVLRNVGMPQSLIQLILMHHFNLLCFKVNIFRNKVEEVVDMGFCPTVTKFINALVAVLRFSESNWQQKIEVYRRCGWSKDEVMSAFKKDPRCMALSEKKIIDSMNFLGNVMDMKPTAIAATPTILIYSLEKRTIPRGLVIRVLKLNGLLDENASFSYVVMKSDDRFLKEYVERNKEQIPYLVDVFGGRISPKELGFQYGH